jgi:hypothetical protein
MFCEEVAHRHRDGNIYGSSAKCAHNDQKSVAGIVHDKVDTHQGCRCSPDTTSKSPQGQNPAKDPYVRFLGKFTHTVSEENLKDGLSIPAKIFCMKVQIYLHQGRNGC